MVVEQKKRVKVEVNLTQMSGGIVDEEDDQFYINKNNKEKSGIEIGVKGEQKRTYSQTPKR